MNRITLPIVLVMMACMLGACSDPTAPDHPRTEVAVTSVAPRTGVPGTHITISGYGFGTVTGNVRITLGSRQLKVLSLSEERIVVEIPSGTTSGEITIQVCGRSVSSGGTFDVMKDKPGS